MRWLAQWDYLIQMIYTMSKLRLLSFAVIALLVMNLALVGFLLLRKPPLPPGERPSIAKEGPKSRIIEQLHFDADQVIQYQKLIDEHKASIKTLRDDIRGTKSQLYQTLNEADGGRNDSLIVKLGELQKNIETTHYNHFKEIKKLCKPDQLEYFNTLTDELADFFSPEKEGRRPLGQ
jgi:periplasmic protein CpxP/Spy